MISTIKQSLIINLKNIPGWSLNRKVVVLECDDFGSIRMPSKKVFEKMLLAGIPVDNSRYTSYDTLADKEDLESLYEILYSVKDKNGKPAVMTPVSNVANPDFEKIRQSGFTEYHYEPFTQTLQRYGRHADTYKVWQEGIEKGIFVPESHGREHISIQLWMQKLLEEDKKVRIAFDHEFVSVDTEGVPKPARQFRPEFFYDIAEQQAFLENSIVDGVKLFTGLFGYKPTIFVPSNDIFHPNLEPCLAATGIPFLYTGNRSVIYNTDGTHTHKRHTFGEKSQSGLRYYMRNCAFEPTDKGYKGIGLTLQQIGAAFRWQKPAIISSHRVNFVGGIDVKNREKGLKELAFLLQAITKRWPDVEFMSSRDLFRLLSHKYIRI